MNPLELVGLAFSRLRTGRVRAVLTMLGVIIGVGSVVALVGIAEGSRSNITSRLSSLGTNLLTISAARANGGGTSTLVVADAEALSSIDSIAGIAPELQTQGTVAAGRTTTQTSIVGTTADYASVRAFNVWQGSFLTDTAVEHALRVAVLGATTAGDLGLDASSLGSVISIRGIPFRVVGILQPKGGSGQDPDDQVLVPLTVVQKYFVGGETVRTIGVSVVSPDQIDAARAEISAVLRSRHELTATAADDFSIFDQAQLLETASSITGTLTLLLGGIASISLVVGGIGIMNIMLVSVRERTREIGIRKAIGARGRDILAQFLIEALTLSGLGGLIGIVLGLTIAGVIGRLGGITVVTSAATLATALLFSLVVGVVFGVWPARQASRLDPVTALHYE